MEVCAWTGEMGDQAADVVREGIVGKEGKEGGGMAWVDAGVREQTRQDEMAELVGNA